MEKMNNDLILNKIQARFDTSILSNEVPYGILTLEVKPESLKEIIVWLKEDSELKCNFLTNLGGVHYPDQKDREFAVVYHLHSISNRFRLRLKVYLPESNLKVPTLTDIYSGANWMERETFDFYGVVFEGHPNLKRILNEDSMGYFPMRKEYELEDQTREDKDDRFFGRSKN